MPSSAMPAAWGWYDGDEKASMECASASMPVHAVTSAGRPVVSAGSRMTRPGSMFAWKMIFLVLVASSVTTAARPTSDPVPAVVGTATHGAMPASSTRACQSSRSSKSMRGRAWPTMRATHLAASIALPPPKAMTPSQPCALKASTPPVTLASVGLPRTSEYTGQSSAAAASATIVPALRMPGSVTSRGLEMPSSAHAAPSSATRPAPKRMDVG
mmetsp:Transcript_13488/g.40156  ORF Transcript_13488/g.40156 Transcript_13488/m.40156 type:complete len:214 (+) Transcript_13488:491-1132(+)